MDISPWLRSLNILTEPGGWLASQGTIPAHVQQALAGYSQTSGWIEHRFAAVVLSDGLKEQRFKPRAAYEAEAARDTVLALAVAHELKELCARRPATPQFGFNAMVGAVVAAAISLQTQTGLRAKAAAAGRGDYAEVDFAHSESAKHFFETVVRPRLTRVDRAMGTALALRAGQTYNPRSEESIQRWGHAWTASVALVPLDWARARGHTTLPALAHAFWHRALMPHEDRCRFYVCGAPLPTATKRVHAELRTRPALAFAIEGSPAVWSLPADAVCSIHIALKALDYVATGTDVFYRGRNILQIYLAVLADCLHAANKDANMSDHGKRQVDAPAGGALDGLAPAQRAALARMSRSRNDVKRAIRAAEGTGTAADTTRLAASGPAQDWSPIVLAGLHFEAAADIGDTEWQPIGGISLWRNFDRSVDWVDLLCVARVGEQQSFLPVSLEDAATDDVAEDVEGGDVRSMLLMRTTARAAISAQQLRDAMSRNDAVMGVCEYVGLGVFVVLEIDFGTI